MLKDLLRQARERGDRAVIFDLTGSFVETIYESRRDILLNPLDVSCPRWSIFLECAYRVELHSAARALIPSDGGRSDPFWIDAARPLLVEACLKLIEEKKTTNADLYHGITTSRWRLVREVNARIQERLPVEGTLKGADNETPIRDRVHATREEMRAPGFYAAGMILEVRRDIGCGAGRVRAVDHEEVGVDPMSRSPARRRGSRSRPAPACRLGCRRATRC